MDILSSAKIRITENYKVSVILFKEKKKYISLELAVP